MINIKDLYTIAGETGAARDRVEQAITWLLSPEAEGIGEKLLRDAFARHHKPIIILVKDEEPASLHGTDSSFGFRFLISSRFPVVIINTREIDSIWHNGTNGELHHPSVEETLAHELFHAGFPSEVYFSAEDSIYFKEFPRVVAFYSAVGDIMRKNPDLTFYRDLMNAPDRSTAQVHIEKFVKQYARSLYDKTNEYLAQDWAWKKYVRLIEEPAIAAQNEVAALRGTPLRSTYISSSTPSDDVLQKMASDQLIAFWEIEHKKKKASENPANPIGWRHRITRSFESLVDRTQR